MRQVLTQKFFERNAVVVARELLGKFLCRAVSLRRRTSKCYMITETEAYDGFKDKASHAHSGKTARNFPMFGEAGRWYVYFTYGMHWMLNIVTGPKDYPAAVLIRGGLLFDEEAKQPFCFSRRLEVVRSAPNPQKGSWLSLNGPAKLTKFLKINKRFNNKPSTKKTGLWIEDRGVKIKPSQIKRAPRGGVDYAGKWAKKPYRFFINSML